MKGLTCFVVLIFLCGSVVAVSGVVPGSYEVDFKPGYSGEFVFDFVLDYGVDADLYVEGDLAEYVSLDKNEIFGREKVVVILDLPSVIESPGVNQIFVGARDEGVDVRGVIKVVVPYPDMYVGLELRAPNVNVGEIVEISLGVFNLGRQVVDVEPRVEIYKGGEMVEVFSGEGRVLGASESLGFNVSFDSLNYSAGDYVAVGLVDYAPLDSFRYQTGLARVENVFRLGEFAVGILNYSDEFVEGQIGRFEVEVESLWDDNMKEVYAEVRIVGSDVGFDTSIVSLGRWEKRTLVGAFDSSDFDESVVDAKIILHYDGGVLSEDIKLNIIKGTSYVFYFGVLGFFVLFVGLVWFIFFRRGKSVVNK